MDPNATSECLSAEELEAYAVGKLCSVAAQMHISACDSCARAAEQIRSNNELLGEVRAAAPHPHLPAYLGSYQVQSLLGVGGMGQVYRSWDPKLERYVALKVLPPAMLGDPQRAARFEREAKLLASLQHPNIEGIYGLEEANGEQFLVLEIVEGETLAERLERGPLPLQEGLDVCKQIASALEAAHEHGVIHRDVKPANIKITPDGIVKVLDFGLAKATHTSSSVQASSLSSSEPAQRTREGAILGTVAYMSPEQARGRPIDKRTDIWSFGCTLYECLTGRRPFRGSTPADVLSAILDRDPDYAALPKKTPPAIRLLLRRCLGKDRKHRLRDMGDALFDLGAPDETRMLEVIPTTPAAARSWVRHGLPVAVVVLGISIGLVGILGSRFLSGASEPVIRTSLLPPPGTRFIAFGDDAGPVALSPDGRRLAFVATDTEGRHLWVRQLDQLLARRLEGTAEATFPFWSPDSRYLGFFAGGKLKTIEASGGPVKILCDALNGRGGSWSKDGVILFSPEFRSAIYSVPGSGGVPRRVTEVDDAKHSTHRWPHFLPDGRHFLYLAAQHNEALRTHEGVYVGSLDDGESRHLLSTDANAAFVSGRVLFHRKRKLMCQSFDVHRQRLDGEPLCIAESILYDAGTWHAAFSASDGHILAYHTGQAGTKLVRFGRTGKELGPVGERNIYFSIRLSPDGKRLAVTRGDPSDIYICDLTRHVFTRRTFSPWSEVLPVWSPDGTRIVYTAENQPDGVRKIVLSSRPGDKQILWESGGTLQATDWSPDGRFIACTRGDVVARTEADIVLLPLQSDESKLIPFQPTPFTEYDAQFSPGGRWIAYTSDETGRDEVYVASFLQGKNESARQARKWRISTYGGTLPRWRRDGQELFYVAPDDRFIAVEVDDDGFSFEVGRQQVLFSQTTATVGFAYDVSPDGQEFIINTPDESQTVPITLVVNWTADMGK